MCDGALLRHKAREKDNENYVITLIRRQADWSNVVSYRHAIVKPKQCHVVIEITVAELL